MINFDIKKINAAYLKDFYDKNRKVLMTSFVVLGCIFFVFYWTSGIINYKKNEYASSAKAIYEKLEKASAMASKIKQDEQSGGRNKMTDASLLAFSQNAGGQAGIGAKIINIRPVPATGNIEHVSLRMENLYYDELVNFIARIEAYDNLRVKAVSFSRRYDNPSMIDVSMEIVSFK